MPTLPMDPSNKIESIFDKDRFKLAAGEKARICLMDQQATYSWVHWIRTGEFDDKGNPRGKYVRCLGDDATNLRDKVDPSNCPACAAAEPGRDVQISYPRRMFAMNTAVYYTDKKGNLIDPKHPTFSVKAFVFGDDKYARIIDRWKEHGDLRTKDMTVSCESGRYQKYDFEIGARCIWTSKEFPELRERMKEEIAKKSPTADLEMLCGSAMSHEALEKYVSELKGGATPEIHATDTEDVSSSLDSVIDGVASEDSAAAPADDGLPLTEESQEASFEDLLKMPA